MSAWDEQFAKRLAEFTALRIRIDAERPAAISVVATILEQLPLKAVPAPLPAEWRTTSVVQELCAAAEQCLATSAERSIAVSRLAVHIASALDESYHRVLRRASLVEALYALGNALRVAGSPYESLSVFDRAQETVDRASFCLDAAMINLGSARTLIALGLFIEAADRIEHAYEIFSSLRLRKYITECAEVQKQLAGRVPRHPRWRRSPW
jgi:tetratricopeptide (TPR) repeat protein